MSLVPREAVAHIAPCRHGGIDYAELEALGIAPEQVLDFSTNVNPFGPPPGLQKSLSDVDIGQYPDSDATQLRRSLSEQIHVPAKNILISSGSTELIRLVALTYFGPKDTVLIIEPTFGEYEIACRIAGASVLKEHLSEQDNFRLRVAHTIQLIDQYHPKGIFITNPNNPTGQYLLRTEFSELLAASTGSLMILDEAYIAFVDTAWSSLDMINGHDLLIMRSMTKDYALTGLRLGYGVAHERIIADVQRVRPPWNVNTIAQKAGIIVMKDEKYLKRCTSELQKAKEYLTHELSSQGWTLIPSRTNFFLVAVGDAAQFRRALLEYHIMVRDCTSFGLPGYIRIGVRTISECQRLAAAMSEIKRAWDVC